MTDVELLTHTKRAAYKNCNRYYFHRHEQHLEHKAIKPGRRRGSNFGSLLYMLRLADDDGTITGRLERETYRHVIRDLISEKLDELYNEIHPSSQEEQDALQLEQTKLLEVTIAYVGIYGIDQRREVTYELPLINPLSGRPMRAFRRAGKIDGVRVISPGRAEIIEDKLTGQIQQVMIDRLPLDDQITEYVDALAYMDWNARVQYRHTRFPGINPEKPKQYKTKPDYPGESLDEFGDRLRADLAERQEFYFDQQTLIFETAHLEQFRLERWHTAKQILRSRFDAKRLGIAAWVKNPSKCFEYGGCQFIPLCTMQEGAIDQYDVHESSDPELNGGGKNGDSDTAA
jgi:hypothetical protein